MKGIIKSIPKIEVSVGFVILLACAVCFDSENMFFLALGAAFIHELAHIGVIYLCGGYVEKIHLAIYGAYIALSKYPMMSYKKEFLIAAAGPAVSVVMAYVFSALGERWQSQQLFIMAGINLMLALLNLLPAYPLDGGRMLRCAAMMFTGEHTANIICTVSGGICAAAVTAFCVFINFRLGFQPSLSVFFVFMSIAFIKNIRL